MKTKADVAIIGCGEAGIFAGYELKKLHPELDIVVVEQGRDIYSRKCPIVAGKVKSCVHCKTCDTMCGFGGAGAFSDGKFNFTTQFGGWLTDYMEPAEVMNLIEYVDSINVAHGATIERYSTSTPEARALEIEALKYDLHLLQAQCKHLGTERNLQILTNIYEDQKDKIEYRFNISVEKIEKLDDGYRLITDQGDVDLSGSRPRSFRRRVVRHPVQGSGHQAHQQPGGHRRSRGAACQGVRAHHQCGL